MTFDNKRFLGEEKFVQAGDATCSTPEIAAWTTKHKSKIKWKVGVGQKKGTQNSLLGKENFDPSTYGL